MMQFYIPEVLGVIQVQDEADKIAEKEFKKFEQKVDQAEQRKKDNQIQNVVMTYSYAMVQFCTVFFFVQQMYTMYRLKHVNKVVAHKQY